MGKHLTEGCVPSFSAVNSFAEFRKQIENTDDILSKLESNYSLFFDLKQRLLIEKTKDFIEKVDRLLYDKIEEKQKAELKQLNTKKNGKSKKNTSNK